MWRHQTSSMSSSSLRHTLLLQHDAPNYVTPEPWIWAESHERLTSGVHLHLKVLRIVAPSSEWLRNMATNAPRKVCGRANCAVFGCKNRSSTSEKNEVHFFRFPKDQSRWGVGTNNKLLVANYRKFMSVGQMFTWYPVAGGTRTVHSTAAGYRSMFIFISKADMTINNFIPDPIAINRIQSG